MIAFILHICSHRSSFEVTRRGTCEPRRGCHRRPTSQSQKCPPRTPNIQQLQRQCVTPELHVVSQGHWSSARLPGSSVCTGPYIPSCGNQSLYPARGSPPYCALSILQPCANRRPISSPTHARGSVADQHGFKCGGFPRMDCLSCVPYDKGASYSTHGTGRWIPTQCSDRLAL